MLLPQNLLEKIKLPKKNSHKGQNGKLLIIGGSELFHAASKWSLDIASKFVDMVFYSSIPANNALIKKAKNEFWNGIIIPAKNRGKYIEEADCILIGPGMERNNDTKNTINNYLKKYKNKKWVIDAGALQMADPSLFQPNYIITPHQKEFLYLQKMQEKFNCLVLLKGTEDEVFFNNQNIKIPGGNAGMTKGGTGDVLAGLIAALYCTHDQLTSAVIGSYINKKAGDSLYKKVGPYFNASDLVDEVPKVFWQELTTLTPLS
jgi:hydroxyethylthiazole kinase-like uncharacterized protein yjeF